MLHSFGFSAGGRPNLLQESTTQAEQRVEYLIRLFCCYFCKAEENNIPDANEEITKAENLTTFAASLTEI